MPVIDYDTNTGTFHFLRPEGAAPFPGAAIKVERNGRRFSFEDVSPQNYYNLRMFKTFYGNEAKATKSAAARIAEISAERNTDYVEKYSDLITGVPYRHQLETINLMQRNDRYALLLEQGLGKTYIALQSFKMFKARDGYLRAVVVCPKVVFATWLHEIGKFAPELRVLAYRGSADERRAQYESCTDFDILLTTYEMLRSTTNRSFESWNGWAWQKLDRSAREVLVRAMPDRLTKPELLLADETSMDCKALSRWRNACGKILAPAADGYWTERHYAYTDYEGIESEWYAMNSKVQFELLHDFVADFLTSMEPNVVVFDEASRLVSPKSKQSEAAEKVRAKRKYLMSGTLCVGRPTDMYMPMKVLDPTIIGMNWASFRDRFCHVSRYNRNIITGYKNVDQLKRKVDPFIVEYRRDDCLDLPDRTVVTCYYEPDRAVVDMYDDVVTAQDSITLDDGTEVRCGMQLQKIQKCMQLLSGFISVTDDYSLCTRCGDDMVIGCALGGIHPGGHGCSKRGESRPADAAESARTIAAGSRNAKLQMLRNDLENILQTEKVIVWYWYRYDLDQITGLLRSMREEYVLATDDDCAEKFESNPDIRVFVGQITQGIGITLNSATTTIYYSHGLALEPRLQSMDRNLRIGQSKPVVVRDYVCRGSVEEAVVSLLQHKQDVKEFMQKRIECLPCQDMQRCLACGVKRYGKGCVHYETAKEAEEKRTLRLNTIGGLYG